MIVGVGGLGLMETETVSEVSEIQLPSLTRTQKSPAPNTVIEGVVAPVLQTLPEGLLLVSITLSPAQKAVGPLGVIVGVGGWLLVMTLTKAEVSEVQVPSNQRTQ